MPAHTLVTYRAQEGERELALLGRPDAPGRLLLLDVPRHVARTDDVHIVDDELTTLAEARLVAAGWADERAVDGDVRVVDRAPSASTRTGGPERELARYATRAGDRVLVGQRIAGAVCLSDRPADERSGGKVLFVQRGIATQAELDALVTDYIAESERRGEPARRAGAALVEDMTRALAA
jgi:hypothetical protein